MRKENERIDDTPTPSEKPTFKSHKNSTTLIGPQATSLESALLEACQGRNINTITKLLSQGASPQSVIHCIQDSGRVNTQTAIGSVLLGEYLARISQPALLSQHRKATFQLLDVLMKAGTDPNIGLLTTLNLIENIDGNDDVLPYLSEHGLQMPNTPEHWEVLTALLAGDLALLEQLSSSGRDMNQRDFEGNCAIHQALRLKAPLPVPVIAPAGDKRSCQWADYLVKLSGLGIDLHKLDQFGMSLLQTALASDQADLAIGLIYAGMDPNIDVESDQTPIFLAAVQGDLTTVKRIIGAGADYEGLLDIPQRLLDKDTYAFAQALSIASKNMTPRQ